jgi:hypothetical protein
MNELRPYASLTALPAPMRTRPGDRPNWIELPRDEETANRLRALALEATLPIEVAVGLLLEGDLVAAELGDLWGLVLAEAATDVSLPRLGPGEKWRQWLSQLHHGVERADDELPSLALPLRVLAQIPPAEQVARILKVEMDNLAAARTLDAAAALHGMTMQAWSLRSALRLARR